MSRSLVRLAAIVCGLLAVPVRLYYDFELAVRQPWSVWFAGAAVVSVLVPFGLFFAISRHAIIHRSELRVDSEQGRFVADAGLRLAPLGILVIVLGAGLAAPVERVPNTDRMRFSTVPGLLPAAVVFGIFLVVGVTVIVINRPRVVLDRDGLSVVGPLRIRRVAWTDLVAGSAQFGPRGRWLYVQTVVPDPGKYGNVAKLPAAWLDVDPLVLREAVRTYTEQPSRREEIGTAAELARLTAPSSARPASGGWSAG